MRLALATLPTRMLPSSRTPITLAVVGSFWAFGSTRAEPSRITATQELLVPRSMPIAISAMPPSPGRSPALDIGRRGDRLSEPAAGSGGRGGGECLGGVAPARRRVLFTL